MCKCGLCEECKLRAAKLMASYVLRRRFEQKHSHDRRTVGGRKATHWQLMKLMAMTGLVEEEKVPTEDMVKSEWGVAMRQLQK